MENVISMIEQKCYNRTLLNALFACHEQVLIQFSNYYVNEKKENTE